MPGESFGTLGDFYQFALRIPVTDPKMVQELDKRRDAFLALNSTIVKPDDVKKKQYYITLQLCHVSILARKRFASILNDLSKQKTNGIKLSKQNKLIKPNRGYETELPVAIIDSSSIEDILKPLNKLLHLERISYFLDEAYIELYEEPVTGQSLASIDCTEITSDLSGFEFFYSDRFYNGGTKKNQKITLEEAAVLADVDQQAFQVGVSDVMKVLDKLKSRPIASKDCKKKIEAIEKALDEATNTRSSWDVRHHPFVEQALAMQTGISEVRAEIDRLKENTKSKFSIRNKAKIAKIEKALTEAMDPKAKVSDVREYKPLQQALKKHRHPFGSFFGKREAKSWTNIHTQLEQEHEQDAKEDKTPK